VPLRPFQELDLQRFQGVLAVRQHVQLVMGYEEAEWERESHQEKWLLTWLCKTKGVTEARYSGEQQL
jgi:hypothetical protein